MFLNEDVDCEIALLNEWAVGDTASRIAGALARLAGISAADEARVVAEHATRMDSARAELRRAGVDVDKMERDAAADLTASLATGGLTEATAPRGADALAAKADRLRVSFGDAYIRSFSGLNTQTLVGGTLLLAVVVQLNSLAYSALVAVLVSRGVAVERAQTLALYITAIAVAPVVEEGTRQLATRHGLGSSYTAALNVYELVSHTRTLVKSGALFFRAAAMRIAVALGMHQVNQAVMLYFQRRAKVEDDPSKETVGLILAVTLHAVWNTITVIFNTALARMVGLR